ncbi:MAG: hypothetical protein ABIJ53_10455, partial [Verrucomicrobiota bacterium]
MKIRKHLSASGLFSVIRQGFAKVKETRAQNAVITVKDALMSGFGMFSLKDSSLLNFDNRRQDEKDGNLKRIYEIERVPSDSQMRTILDEVEPEELLPTYKDVFQQAQRGKVLEEMVFLGGYLLSIDG